MLFELCDMKVIAIMVTYNGMKWYDKSISSLETSDFPIQTIIVDNASSDGTIEYIKNKYPNIQIIELQSNLGFAKASNIGIKYALEICADYVFLINQDAWIEIFTIEKLLNVFITESDTGIVSPIHLNGNNTMFDYGFENYLDHRNTPNFISDLYYGRLKTNYRTNSVNAAAWLVSRKCIEKIGGFDTSLFFHYGEDSNYCQRVRYHNFSIYINTEAIIYHGRDYNDGKWPDIYNKQSDILTRKIYYADPFLHDEIISNQIHSLKRSYKKKRMKYFLMFKFGKLKQCKKYFNNEFDFFFAIEKSRIAYKTGVINWLDKNSV